MRRLFAAPAFRVVSRCSMLQRALPFFLTAALAGCAVGPRFTTPEAPSDSGYRKDALPAQTTAIDGVIQGDAQRFINSTAPDARWWSRFNNAELDRRVDLALVNSPTIASAQAALRQAQANVDASRGSLFPSLDAQAGTTRTKSAFGNSGVSGGGATPPATSAASAYTIYNAGVSIGYTLDLFGGVRRGIDAQQALADAQRYVLGGTYLSLATNVVTTSFREASLREQIASNEEIISLFREQLDLVQRQFDIGVKSMGDVLQARAQIASAQALLPELRKQLAATQTQLAVYLGETPASAELTALSLDKIALPTNIPVSLPSDLVRQRPDIRAAEAQLQRTTAQVGIATANLFPQVTLSGSWGSQALEAGDLFGSGTAAWSLGLNLLQPIFRGGTLRAQKRAAEAGLDQASADYRTTVLQAFQNVADSLRALELDADGLAAQAAAESATADSLDLVRKQFRDGSINYLQVLDSTRLYQQARLAVISARATRLSDTAALYAALGGGWQDVGDAAAATTPAAN